MKPIPKSGTDQTIAAAADDVVYTVSPGVTGSLTGARCFSSNWLVITNLEAGAATVEIWDGPSAGGNIMLGPLIIPALTTIVFGPGFVLQFYTSVTVRQILPNPLVNGVVFNILGTEL